MREGGPAPGGELAPWLDARGPRSWTQAPWAAGGVLGPECPPWGRKPLAGVSGTAKRRACVQRVPAESLLWPHRDGGQ